MQDEEKTKEQLIAESACSNASEYTLTLPIEYQRGKHRGRIEGNEPIKFALSKHSYSNKEIR